MHDTLCALLVLVAAFGVLTASWIRWIAAGPEKYARIEADGGSVLLGSGLMNKAYWALQPLATFCIAAGVTANGVTAGSLVLGMASGIAMWQGALGVGALLAMLSSVGDAIDGLVARKTGVASSAGEVFDAAADRYVEFFFLGGLVLHYGNDPWPQALALLALVGSFMTSYASSRAEALRIKPPRGAMRRPERAVYLTMAAALTPLVGGFRGVTPMTAALLLVATVANVSAISRLRAIARRGGIREAAPGRGTIVEPTKRALPLSEESP